MRGFHSSNILLRHPGYIWRRNQVGALIDLAGKSMCRGSSDETKD